MLAPRAEPTSATASVPSSLQAPIWCRVLRDFLHPGSRPVAAHAGRRRHGRASASALSPWTVCECGLLTWTGTANRTAGRDAALIGGWPVPLPWREGAATACACRARDPVGPASD